MNNSILKLQSLTSKETIEKKNQFAPIESGGSGSGSGSSSSGSGGSSISITISTLIGVGKFRSLVSVNC